MAVSVVAVLSVIFYARIRYNKNGHVPAADGESIPGWQKLLVDKYRIDELYDAIVARPVVAASSWIQKIFETNFFDRIVNGVGQVVILAHALHVSSKPEMSASMYSLWLLEFLPSLPLTYF
jgi:NADH-quinone oxidoreductase subunit L